MTNIYKKNLPIFVFSILLAAIFPVHGAVTGATANVLVTPDIIQPGSDGVIRFSIGVENIPDPGLSSFALSVRFGSGVNLVSSVADSSATPIPGDQVSCSGTLLASQPTETVIPGIFTQVQSGLGSFLLNGLGTGSILSVKNEFTGNVGEYAFGLGGDLTKITPQVGNGPIIEFRCHPVVQQVPWDFHTR